MNKKLVQLFYYHDDVFGLDSEGDIYKVDLLNMSFQLLTENPLGYRTSL